MLLLLHGLSILLLIVAQYCCGSGIVEIVSDIAAQEHQALPEGLEVCFFQLHDYSIRSAIGDLLMELVQDLGSKYPVTAARQYPPVSMYHRKDASFVVFDATGYAGQFPTELASRRLRSHECYARTSKFVVLVSAPLKLTSLCAFFDSMGILNYLVAPIEADPLPNSSIKLYTRNRFTRQEYFFDSLDHSSSSLHRYFPDKLSNVQGYQFRLFSLNEFPYVIDLRNNRTAGVLFECLRFLIERKLNGTIAMVHDKNAKSELTFAYTEFRAHYMHDVTLKERTGDCVVCPFRTERDFMRHLLKPFSLGIWLVLGGLMVTFWCLGRLCPRLFPRNLLSLVLSSDATRYRRPFPVRALSFATAVLIFFLSEAYNAKIISLMSLSKYYERPETVQELAQSDLLIAVPGVRMVLLAEQLPGKVVDYRRAQQLYRERQNEMYSEYCTVMPWFQAILLTAGGYADQDFQLYAMREQVSERFLTLQLASDSPFYPTFVDFLERYFQSGIWLYRVRWIKDSLATIMSTMLPQLEGVVFGFEDLWCIWVLIIVGWAVSGLVFVGELLPGWMQTVAANVRCRRRKIVCWAKIHQPRTK